MYIGWNKIKFPPPQKALYMNLEATRSRGRPRNGWHDEMSEDGRLVCGKKVEEKIYITEMSGRSS